MEKWDKSVVECRIMAVLKMHPDWGRRRIARETELGIGVVERTLRVLRDRALSQETVELDAGCLDGDQGPLAIHRKVRVGANFLVMDEDVSDEDIREVLGTLKRVETSYQWLLGDFLCQVERLRGNDLVKLMMQGFDVSEGRAYDARRVCGSIPRERRLDISFTHHLTALIETDIDVDSALGFLGEAIDGGWSVAELRKAIRRARAEPGRLDGGGGGSGSGCGSSSGGVGSRVSFSDVYSAVAFVRRTRVRDLPKSDRVTLKNDLQPLVDWWKRL